MGLILRSTITAVALGIVTPMVAAQDPRLERPEKLTTPAEVWRAVEYELNTGKYAEAAYYVKLFLDRKPTDKDLVELESKLGIARFLRLRNVVQWSPDPTKNKEARDHAEAVISLLTAAVDKSLGDAARTVRLVNQLKGTDEERGYAIRELQRSGARVMPHVIAALQADADPLARVRVLEALPQLREETVNPLLAALDMPEMGLKRELLNLLGERRDFTNLPASVQLNPVPTLEYLSASPKQSADVRQKARDLLVRLRPVSPTRFRPAVLVLTQAALRFFRHQERFTDPQPVIYRWENDRLVGAPLTPSQAEEYLGMRYARWALELAPTDRDAQVAFLSIAVDKAFKRAGLSADLAKVEPRVHALMATASVETLIATLDQALLEQQTAVALGVTRVLGERAEPAAAREWQGRPGVLQRALDYGDRRVQFAAAEALLHVPGPEAKAVSGKIVETLRRALSSESEATVPSQPRALVSHFNRDQLVELSKAFRGAGYDVMQARTGREVLDRARLASDIDLIVVDSTVSNPPLPDLLATLRQDSRTAGVPVSVVYMPRPVAEHPSIINEARLGRITPQTAWQRQDEIYADALAAERISQLAGAWKGVRVLEGPVTAEAVRTAFARQSADTPSPLSPAEKKAYAARAIELFRQIAISQSPSFELAPAERAIRQAASVPELAPAAIAVLGHIPGREPQVELASVALDASRPQAVRILAVDNLTRHMQKYGRVLAAEQVRSLVREATTEPDPAVRGRIADLVGIVQSDAATTGRRMQDYKPTLGAPTPKPTKEPAKEPPADPEPQKKDDDK